MTYYEEPENDQPIIDMGDTSYITALAASLLASRAGRSYTPLFDEREAKRVLSESREKTPAVASRPIPAPRQIPDYPKIKAAEIEEGDTVYLSGPSVKSPHFRGRFRVIKAKPIIGGRVQIKIRSTWHSSNKIQKINLDETASVELQERGGQSMDRNPA